MTPMYFIAKYLENVGDVYAHEYSKRDGRVTEWDACKSDALRFPKELMERLIAANPDWKFEPTLTYGGETK